jgi:hypothetical protein
MWTARIRKRFQPVICAAPDKGDELPVAVVERGQGLADRRVLPGIVQTDRAFDCRDVLVGTLPEF